MHTNQVKCGCTLDITSASLALYGLHMKRVVELGEFEIMVGDFLRKSALQKLFWL